jgi:translocation and assembly module TamA
LRQWIQVLVRLTLSLWLATAWSAQQELLVVSIEDLQGELLDNVANYLDIRQLAGPAVTDSSLLSQFLNKTKLSEILPLAELLEKAAGPSRTAVQPVSYYQLQVSESRLRWLHARGEENIRQALQPFGYYHPTIAASLERNEQGWVARYKIEPGPSVRITKLTLRVSGAGGNDPAFQELLAHAPLKPGERLIQPRYTELKKQLELLATERGYFDAHWQTHEIRLDPANNSAVVTLLYDTGRRYHFGQIHWSDTALDPALLQRYLKFQPGDPYDSKALLNLQSDLISSGYFQQVEVATPREKAVNYRVPVDITLEMRDSRQYSLGFGYGTDTGVRGRFGFEQRWLHPWGDRFKVELLASQIGAALTTEYTIPGIDPVTEAFVLRGGLSYENSPAIKNTYTGLVGASWKKQYGLWQGIGSLDYRVDSFEFENRQISHLLIPGISVTRIDVDDPVNINQGTLLALQLRGAYEPLLSDTSFIQGIVNGKWIQRLSEHGRLIARGSLGTIAVSDFNALPPALRFFTGGDTSVRGYQLDTIAPRNARGTIIGGKHLIVGSLEYEYRFWGNWGIAAFVDSGDAFTNTLDMRTGAGLGLRWFSPVGPLRLDLAHGFEYPGDSIRLHLTFGPEL